MLVVESVFINATFLTQSIIALFLFALIASFLNALLYQKEKTK